MSLARSEILISYRVADLVAIDTEESIVEADRLICNEARRSDLGQEEITDLLIAAMMRMGIDREKLEIEKGTPSLVWPETIIVATYKFIATLH